MNAHIAIWACVILTGFIFVIEILSIKRLKNQVLEKIQWESEE